MDTRTIVVLEGDQTGQELLEASLRVLQPDVVGFELALPRFDLSLGNRRTTSNGVVHEAARAIADHGLGLKAATVTPEGRDDVGSPNRILREDIGGKVIVRTGRRIPGVLPVGGVHSPISVVRMAVGDAYGARETVTTRSRSVRSASSGRSAVQSRSSPSGRPSAPAQRSSAVRSTRSARSTREC